MKILLLVTLFSLPGLAQDPSMMTRATAACGPVDQDIQVKVQKSPNHPLGQPEPGKALVYVVQDDHSGTTNFWGFTSNVTTRFGLDGKWVGANRGSYFFFSIEPGDLHLCGDRPTDVDDQRSLVSVTRLKVEAGKTYYVRILLEGNGCAGTRHPVYCQPTRLELDTLDEDKGQLLVASSRFSTSHVQN